MPPKGSKKAKPTAAATKKAAAAAAAATAPAPTEPETTSTTETVEAPEAAEPTPAAAAAATTTKTPAESTAAAATTTTSEPETPAPSTEAKHTAYVEELQRRKTRAEKFGLPIDDIVKKIERAIKFQLTGDEVPAEKKVEGAGGGGETKRAKGHVAPSLDAELGEGRKGRRGKDGAVVTAAVTESTPKVAETEEQKAERIAQQEKDAAAKARRAERFGLVDKDEEERKRKRAEKFGSENGGAADGESAQKKVKA
ncbi:hypothetical protein CF327_g3114 [Tilletia walkeri]|uniref:THO1-MOS11 C-terminal domain-containing protein n=1 Tax=Tilletia walkeri TaxID=117179 RepID=A0A8X7N7Y3_9BASI|nr:hypothetical protein CF327_g3114 [Tilletia walkeri]KAE8268801.1 hypothetical protein A4X09_0g3531 [Tilletia walkeri]